jgi:hypothetical protein
MICETTPERGRDTAANLDGRQTESARQDHGTRADLSKTVCAIQPRQGPVGLGVKDRPREGGIARRDLAGGRRGMAEPPSTAGGTAVTGLTLRSALAVGQDIRAGTVCALPYRARVPAAIASASSR